MKQLSFMLALVFLIAYGITFSQVPQTISYQGVLTNVKGDAVTNGTYSLTFKIYEVATGDTSLWTEVQSVQVQNGIFNVILGNVMPLNLLFDRQYWLGVTIGSESELTPRLQFTSTAYSLNARTIVNNAVTSEKIANGAVTPAKINSTGASTGQALTFDGSNVVWGRPSGGGLSLPFAGSVASSDNAFSITNAGTGIAVRGLSTNTGDITNYGGYFEAHGLYGRGVTGAVSGNQAYGVYGFAKGIGVGVYGESGGEGTGVVGSSVNGTGVSGFGSGNGHGVKGTSNGSGAAVRGLSSSSPGVEGWSGSGHGVYGYSTSGNGGYFSSEAGRAGYFEIKNTNNTKEALAAHTNGKGTTLYVSTYGTGRAGFFGINNPSNNKPALEVSTNGSGPAILANGSTVTKVLEITGGADLSEQFDINNQFSEEQIQPGMVVSIDPENPGKLVVSRHAYDHKVAGIISGAGGVKPGMLMRQSESIADGQYPVALTGRVYCLANASNGSIQIGDLLTTSDRPGYAMKVTDYTRAQGAIIGKAMSKLEARKGLILVLVTLQ